MFDRFLDFLNRLPGSYKGAEGPDEDDPRIAAAALLTHVMDADGERTAGEREALKALLTQAFDVKGKELKEVLAAGEEAHRDAVDLYAFTSVLNRHLDREGKTEFISLMWDMVYSDGVVHELEDNLVWRVAELIHVEREERIALRQNAQARAGIPVG
ncbi:MAG: TerB family tellurite resistance protein [Rhizobiaceae bacterium]|nr:TerB family tellurite resistance protein [Rhizobiaceae bacterium]